MSTQTHARVQHTLSFQPWTSGNCAAKWSSIGTMAVMISLSAGIQMMWTSMSICNTQHGDKFSVFLSVFCLSVVVFLLLFGFVFFLHDELRQCWLIYICFQMIERKTRPNDRVSTLNNSRFGQTQVQVTHKFHLLLSSCSIVVIIERREWSACLC